MSYHNIIYLSDYSYVMMKNLLLFCLLFTYVQLFGQKSTDFIDPIDGQVYPTVRICGSTLHTRNLNAAHFRNGDTIAQARNKAQWMYYQQNNIPAWTYYNADSLQSTEFGKLYNLSFYLEYMNYDSNREKL